MLELSQYLDYIHCDLADSYFTNRKENQFYLNIRDGTTRVYYAEPRRTKSLTFNTFQKVICSEKT